MNQYFGLSLILTAKDLIAIDSPIHRTQESLLLRTSQKLGSHLERYLQQERTAFHQRSTDNVSPALALAPLKFTTTSTIAVISLSLRPLVAAVPEIESACEFGGTLSTVTFRSPPAVLYSPRRRPIVR